MAGRREGELLTWAVEMEVGGGDCILIIDSGYPPNCLTLEAEQQSRERVKLGIGNVWRKVLFSSDL